MVGEEATKKSSCHLRPREAPSNLGLPSLSPFPQFLVARVRVLGFTVCAGLEPLSRSAHGVHAD
ncbi:hypothetical protein K0M31_014722 [Melipona bicolor]|uniref:Uncharacterized protein n=1 Tax=Melipona bicolor TaxID=60889 RepID=A0AA40KFS0_9HYME|nr:hypothetical protein K0M31_014722 [Melipona bicolor]